MKTRGFTLIELIIVIAVIGIIVAILVPVLKKTKSTESSAKPSSGYGVMVTPTPVPATPASGTK